MLTALFYPLALRILFSLFVSVSHGEFVSGRRPRLVLQIHDEVILQGPQEHGEEALTIVKCLMSSPFFGKYKFRTELVVDGDVGQTWYECK